MEIKKLEDLSKRKIKYEEQENNYYLELESLKSTKLHYEANEQYYREEERKGSLYDSYDNIIKIINNSIEENERKMNESASRKKAIATIIRTVKGSNTKIKNKRKKINELNIEIENIQNEISELENKRKELDNIEKTNIEEILVNLVTQKIKEYDEQILEKNQLLSEKNNELIKNEKAVKSAEKAKETSLSKYNESEKNNKVKIKIKKRANDRKKTKRIEKLTFEEDELKPEIEKFINQKAKEIKAAEERKVAEINVIEVLKKYVDKRKLDEAFEKEEVEENNSEFIYFNTEKENTSMFKQELEANEQKEEVKQISNKTCKEILLEAQQAYERVLSEEGGMFSDAQRAYDEVIKASGKEEEIRSKINKNGHTWSDEEKYEISVDEITDISKSENEPLIEESINTYEPENKSLIEESIDTYELETKSSIQESIDTSKLENEHSIEKSIDTYELETKNLIEENIDKMKTKSRTSIKETASTKNSEPEDIFSSSILEKLNYKNNFKQGDNKPIIKKITLKEYSNYGDIPDKNIYGKYIDIDGKKYEINRNLDKDTENELNELCKNVLGIEGKASIIKKMSIQRLKEKIDPAIINAIKENMMVNLEKWDYAISKLNDLKKISYANKEKAEIEKEYNKLLRQYVESIEEKNTYKNPFNIIYDCSEKMSSKEYNNIKLYINVAEKIGGQVLGKRRVFGLFEEKENSNNVIQNVSKPKYVEGDKSFVTKVETNTEELNSNIFKTNKRTRINQNEYTH